VRFQGLAQGIQDAKTVGGTRCIPWTPSLARLGCRRHCQLAGSPLGFHHAEHAPGRMVETEIGDTVPGRWVVADHRHLKTDLSSVTQLPACREQLRVDEQGTRLGFVQFHRRFPLGNNGPRRILFSFRSSDFTALGPAPTNSWGMVYSGPSGSARRISIRVGGSSKGDLLRVQKETAISRR